MFSETKAPDEYEVIGQEALQGHQVKVICFASVKGGSGKTMVTATFGNLLSKLGYRALLIDTDAATNGLTLLYLRPVREQAETSITKAVGLFDWEPGREHLVTALSDTLYLLPVSYDFHNTEEDPISGYRKSLKQAVMANRSRYDFILIDAQAGSDPHAQIAMSKDVSDEVVIVSEYDPMSAAGVERLKALFPGQLAYHRTWVLLNKMLPEFVESFHSFLEVAKYLSPIPWDPDVVRAYARREIALDVDAPNSHTFAVVETLKSLLGRSFEERLRRWNKSKKQAALVPIKEEVAKLERELEALYAQRTKFKVRETRSYSYIVLTLALMSAMLVFVDLDWLWGVFGLDSGPSRYLVLPSIVLIMYIAFYWQTSWGRSARAETEGFKIETSIGVIEERFQRLSRLIEGESKVLIGDSISRDD